jgi:Tfp pilus assembly PilM family ATPase/Tfp pilus assembly protein PilN
MEMAKAGPRVLTLLEEPLQLEPTLTDAQRAQRMARQLIDMLKKGGVRAKNAVFCVPGQSVFVRRRKLPKANPDRMGQMIRFEARQQIPFPLDQTILQYQVFQEPDEAEADVLLVAVKRDFINHFMRMVSRTGLRPLSISVSSLALYNFHELNTGTRDLSPGAEKKRKKDEKKGKATGVATKADKGKKGLFGFGKKKDAEQVPQGDADAVPSDETTDMALDDMSFEEIQAYVNLGASLMDLAIPKPGTSRMIGFTRSVPLAGNDMDRAVRDKLGSDSLDAARQIKETRAAVLSTQFEIEGDADAVDMAASEAVTAIADRMISELRRSLDYYISQPDGVAVDKLVLSGGLARLPYLSSYIEEKMGLPVELAQPKHEQLRMPDRMPDNFAPFAIAVGLAAQGLNIAQNQIDFLPEEIKNVRGLSERPFEIAAMIMMLVVIIALSANVGASRIQSYRTEVDFYNSQKDKLEKLNGQISEALKRDEQVTTAFKKLAKAGSQRDYWMRFLQKFIEQLPPEILIDDLQMRIDGNVIVRGRTPSLAAVTQFCNQMKAQADIVAPAAKDSKTPEGAAMNTFKLERDPRFPNNVYSFTVTIRTKLLNQRIRPIGEAPVTPEMRSRMNMNTNGAAGMFNPFGGRGAMPPGAAPMPR